MEQNQKKQPAFLPRKGSLNLRLIGGGYLLYLCYQLGKGLSETKQNQKLIMMAAIVVFAVVGVIIFVTSLKALKEGRFVGGAMDHSEDMAENTEENVTENIIENTTEVASEETTQEVIMESTPDEETKEKTQV